MKLTKKDYQSALKVWQNYWECLNELTFPGYMEVKLDELEEQKPKTPMYRCIQVPFIKDGFFKLGELYDNSGLPKSCNLADLPKHFELVEPEPEPVSPWRTDIENAPRDGRNIFIVCETGKDYDGCYISYSYNDNPEFPWHSYENDTFFKDIDITHWMEIPELPEL